MEGPQNEVRGDGVEGVVRVERGELEFVGVKICDHDDEHPTIIVYPPGTVDGDQEPTVLVSPIQSDSGSSGSGTTSMTLALSVGDLPLPERVSKAGPSSDPLAQQEGRIQWIHGYFYSVTPEWLFEPDMSCIKRIVEPHLEKHGFGTKDISVEFFAGGALNKLYTITSTSTQSNQQQQCIFRVAMPVDPWYKTESEVATIEYIRRHTTIPVPKVYAYDSSVDNKLGLEWIMMEKMKGQPLLHHWDTHDHKTDRFNMSTKLHIAKTVAEWVHQLSKLTFDKIGSLYIDWDSQEPTFKLGRTVDIELFRGRRLAYKVFRGPFRDVEQYYRSVIESQLQEIHDPAQKTYLEARLLRIKRAQEAEEERARQAKEAASKKLEEGMEEDVTQEKEKEMERPRIDWDRVDDEDDWYNGNDFTGIPKVCHTLLSVLPVILLQDPPAKEQTVLFHFDISVRNVLVDDSGNPIGLVDWEIISTSPYESLQPYPVLFDNDGFDVTTLEPWEGGDKDRTRLQQELEYAKTLMGKAFRKYLEEINSPWLRAFDEPSTARSQLMKRVHEIPRHQRGIEEWALCMEEGREWDSLFG